jgi:hypothetical protein
MEKGYFQQGDVLLKPIKTLPGGLTPIKNNVLQEGETTGHKHQFPVSAAVNLFEMPVVTKGPGTSLQTITPNGDKFLVVMEPAQLLHEEHNPITVPPGTYQVDIVREWDYNKAEATRVVD